MSRTEMKDYARTLARSHKREDRATSRVLVSYDDDAEEIRLVEVSGSVGYVGEVLPVRYSARPELNIPFSSSILLLSPDEFDELERGELTLPPHWGSLAEFTELDADEDDERGD